jgi:hypothetical protein
MTQQRVESATIWRATDINYPGVPQPPPEVVTRATSRAVVDYEIYVNAYAAQQRGHVLLSTFGVVLTIGAAFYLSPPWLIITIAAGIGMLFAGAVGFGVAMDAHRSYTRDLAVSVSETYERPAPPPPPATVRPFVVDDSNGHRTIRTGRLDFQPPVWQSLFNRALANGGSITRDDAKDAGVGRTWYHGEGWGKLQQELQRQGIIDARNRITDRGLAWYDEHVPLPLAAFPARSRRERTNGERTANERPQQGEEWGES